jgi:hypothetical protein
VIQSNRIEIQFWVRLVLALAASVLSIAGCSVQRVAADSEARAQTAAAITPVPPEAWPARWSEGLHGSTLWKLSPASGSLEFDGRKQTARMLVPTISRSIVTSTGLISFSFLPSKLDYLLRDWDAWESEERIRGIHEFQYVSWRPGQPPVWELPPARSDDPDAGVFLERAVNRSGIDASFRLIMPEKVTEPAGVVLFVPPISNAVLSIPVPNELRRRGWAVLSVDTLEMVQNARVAMVVDVPWDQAPKERSRRGDRVLSPQIGGRWMGEWLRDDMADMAYAYEAALDFALRSEPSLVGRPVVVIGASLGAIFTSPIAARLGDRLSGAVLIGGGANMLGVIGNTDPSVFKAMLTIGGDVVKVNPAAVKKWHEAYLKTNTLDPAWTAPHLARIPTLIIDAKNDGIIRPEFGQLLWEKAGRPERWSIDCGHIWLFLSLKDRAGEIADWVEAAVAADPKTTTPRSASAAP